MTDPAEANRARVRRWRERRKAGLAVVTVTDDREPSGVKRGVVTTDKARKIIEWIDAQEKRDGEAEGH